MNDDRFILSDKFQRMPHLNGHGHGGGMRPMDCSRAVVAQCELDEALTRWRIEHHTAKVPGRVMAIFVGKFGRPQSAS